MGGFFGAPAGDEYEVMSGGDLFADFDESGADEAADVVALVRFAGFF